MDFNKLKEMGLEYAEKGKNAAMDLAERGKTQAKIVSEQAKLAKAQRQLGALVYSLAKGNEENQPLVDKYIEMIDSIEQELASLKEALGPAAVEITRDLEEEPAAADAAPTEEPAAETPAAAEDAPKTCPSAVLWSRTMRCSATSAARSCKYSQNSAGAVSCWGTAPFVCEKCARNWPQKPENALEPLQKGESCGTIKIRFLSTGGMRHAGLAGS